MMRVLSITQNATGDWVIVFDGPKMERIQVTHRGDVDPATLEQISDQLEPRMHKLPAERA